MPSVKIEYGTVKNLFQNHGHLPVIWVNDRRIGSTYASEGHDESDALTLAESDARAEAARYVGDWDVTVSPRK